MLLSRENKNVISAFSVLPSHTLRIYLFLLVSFIIKDHIFSILDLLKKKAFSKKVHNSNSRSPQNSCGWGIFDKALKSLQKEESNHTCNKYKEGDTVG